ncbi:MAG: hypothetical protein FJX76_01635 [Armatimonadetes bacterium]|nr:hypothetical protein [Armatimonadota bacterium]
MLDLLERSSWTRLVAAFLLAAIAVAVWAQPHKRAPKSDWEQRCTPWPDHALLRHQMIQMALEFKGVTDPRILAAFQVVPRHLFVDEAHRPTAYHDVSFEDQDGHLVLAPYPIVVLAHEGKVAPGSRVLLVGVGSGYEAAVLRALGADVFGLAEHPSAAERARTHLSAVTVGAGPLPAGWPEKGPYDAILIPPPGVGEISRLLPQLREGGLLVDISGPRVRVVNRQGVTTFGEPVRYK